MKSADVMRIWPSPVTNETIELATTDVSDTTKNVLPHPKNLMDGETLSKWFRKRIDAWPVEKSPPSEATDFKIAEKDFPNKTIRRKLFREIRKDMVPWTWRRQGQRR
jgi:hypothetical protein